MFRETFYADTVNNAITTAASLLATVRRCPRRCPTSCESRSLKTRKALELGRPPPFFFPPSPTTTSGSWAARKPRGSGKSLIHLGRRESGVNPRENNVEGWIMMIVETTYGSLGIPRNGRAVFGCIAHPSVTHNRQSFTLPFLLSPAFPPNCVRIDKLVLFHPYILEPWG